MVKHAIGLIAQLAIGAIIGAALMGTSLAVGSVIR